MKVQEPSPQELYNKEIQKTIEELNQFSQGRKLTVLFPCFLELSLRILKEAESRTDKEFSKSLKSVLSGFTAQAINL